MTYTPNEKRYENMIYKYSGKSGLKLPVISLGLWHSFSDNDDYDNMVNMIKTSFDLGITHFDLANNYGRPYPGSAERNFGKILKDVIGSYRDEIVISTKAGYVMNDSPYGFGGSRKYLMSSLDSSLKRMGLDYVDIFYHHCMDKETPLEESMGALIDIVKSGKALYVGISNYDAKTTMKASEILENAGVHPLIHQFRLSMMDKRVVENGTLEITKKMNMGTIAFSPLEQGLLSDKYLKGIPEGSRASKPDSFLKKESITKEKLEKISRLNEIAKKRGQTLSQMAISYLLTIGDITSVLVGASSPKQIIENVNSINNLEFTKEEIEKIDGVLNS